MQYHNRTGNSKDVEAAAETMISSYSFLKNAIDNMSKETRKTVSFQQTNTESFDSYTEKRK